MQIKNRNKFRLTRFIIFKGIWTFKFLSSFRKPNKRLLLIKVDAIGDYILFRNFLEEVSKSEKYREYSIELLGSKVWKDLAIKFDAGFVSNFIFIDSESFYEKPWAVLKLGWKLFNRKYEVVLQSTFSRTLMSNAWCGFAAGKEAISFNSSHELHKYKKRTDKFYTSLLDLPPHIFHEFDKNRYFFERILHLTKLRVKEPNFNITKEYNKGIVVFPGSSFHKRNWSKENFLEVIRRLLSYTTEPIIIAGGPSEVSIAEYLMNNLPVGSVTNKTGRMSLVDLVYLIANARLLITNETSAVHIAVACKSKSICIIGGGHFNRFTPYPDEFEYKPTTVYTYMPCFNCNWLCQYKSADEEPFPCLSHIDLENVWKEVAAILSIKPQVY